MAQSLCPSSPCSRHIFSGGMFSSSLDLTYYLMNRCMRHIIWHPPAPGRRSYLPVYTLKHTDGTRRMVSHYLLKGRKRTFLYSKFSINPSNSSKEKVAGWRWPSTVLYHLGISFFLLVFFVLRYNMPMTKLTHLKYNIQWLLEKIHEAVCESPFSHG